MARDCYSRTKPGTHKFQQNQQTSNTADEATLQFSQFVVSIQKDTPPDHEMTSNESDNEGEQGTESDDDSKSEEEILSIEKQELDMEFQLTSEAKESSSSITNEDSKERLRLFHTWGEKPTMGTDPKGADTSEWGDTPLIIEKGKWRATVDDTKKTWGEATKTKEKEACAWCESRPMIVGDRNSPTQQHYRFTTCQFCDTPMCTRKANGKLTCSEFLKWINEDDSFYENETDDEDANVADDKETLNSEEDDANETLATSAPHTPPRQLRQAATYILNLVRQKRATDGIIVHHRDAPAILSRNYYSVLQEESRDIISKTKRRMALRPELLQFGLTNLRPKVLTLQSSQTKVPNEGLLLTQNVTTLQMKNANMKVKTKSTQTPDTVSTTIADTEVSFVSSSAAGLTAPLLMANRYDSDSSTQIAHRCFQPGEPCESNSEASERHREIARNILQKKKRRDKRRRRLSRKLQTLREREREVESDEEAAKTILTKRSRSPTNVQQLRQNVQLLTLDDINPHGLYPNQTEPATKQPIDLLYDTGASITMLPLDYAPAWRNLRPCLHQLTGCFATEGTHHNLQIGEFHGLLKLDSDEMVRIVIPEAIALPPETSTTYLLSDTQFLQAGNNYVSDLKKPSISFSTGGTYTMSVQQAHKVIQILPVEADKETQHRLVYAHLSTKYDPPTYQNHALHTKRPNAHTPPAYQWHLRYACACQEVLQRTQVNVKGMQVQQNSWKQLESLLPCSGCVPGKMRKTNKAQPFNYTDVQQLALVKTWVNNALSRTAATTEQINTRNDDVTVDWAIVNKTAIPGEPNVFAVYLDTNIGIVHTECTTSRGQAGETLLKYIQQWGVPKRIHHDNAEEFLNGNFAEICKEKGIKQTQSAPYTPNQNPTEKYMDILVSGARSLLFTAGLPPAKFWTHAVQHRTLLQNFMALPGRCTPYELATGKQPNVSTLRIFDCEAMAYIERDKRKKFSSKTERCIYLGISPTHSHDTYKLFYGT